VCHSQVDISTTHAGVLVKTAFTNPAPCTPTIALACPNSASVVRTSSCPLYSRSTADGSAPRTPRSAEHAGGVNARRAPAVSMRPTTIRPAPSTDFAEERTSPDLVISTTSRWGSARWGLPLKDASGARGATEISTRLTSTSSARESSVAFGGCRYEQRTLPKTQSSAVSARPDQNLVAGIHRCTGGAPAAFEHASEGANDRALALLSNVAPAGRASRSQASLCHPQIVPHGGQPKGHAEMGRARHVHRAGTVAQASKQDHQAD
jgi:hypothetical protein